MKITLIYIPLFLLSVFEVKSQMTSLPKEDIQPRKAEVKSDDEKVLKKGNHVINMYYGTNLLTAVFRKVVPELAQDVKIKSLGPIGFVYEYMASDHVGIGAEFGYSQTAFHFVYPYTYEDQNTGQTRTENFNYSLNFTRFRGMVRANFHFVRDKDFDCYGLISVGYRSTKFVIKTDNPYNDLKLSFNATLVPVGIKPGIGFRYFFTQNFGLNLELAAGTPLLCGGLAFKL